MTKAVVSAVAVTVLLEYYRIFHNVGCTAMHCHVVAR